MRTAESLLNRAIFKNVLGAYYRGWYVVVHLYSIFSIRCQMTPVQSIKFQTANFPIFSTRIIVIFSTTCIAREVFSLVIRGNVTHILPVLHWLEVVIAFVSRVIYFIYSFFLFVTLHVGRRLLWCVVDLLPQDIALAFVGRFRCGFPHFFAEDKRFLRMEQFSKLSLGGATIGAQMAGKNYENLRKWVQSLCAPLRPFKN